MTIMACSSAETEDSTTTNQEATNLSKAVLSINIIFVAFHGEQMMTQIK